MPAPHRIEFAASIVAALVVGTLLAVAARTGALELLVAVAAGQALLAYGYVFGLAVPGWFGALAIAGMAGAAADALVWLWPHGRLGALLAVFGLAVPVLFVHQLWRGAARFRIGESLGAIAVLVLAEVGLAALVQIRHEFDADVALAVIVIATGALVVGHLVDLVVAAPRFDRDVPRGLLAALGSAVAGAVVGQLTLADGATFGDGRGPFAGACIGALAALFSVGIAFLAYSVPLAEAGFARRVRPLLGVLLPLCLVAPVAFLVCSAIRA